MNINFLPRVRLYAMTTAAEERTELSGNLLVGVFEMNTTDPGRVHDQGRGEREGPHRPHRVPPQYNVVRGATIYLSKYMVEAIPVSAISQCVIIIVNNIEMHVHLSSLEPTELVNGLASLLLLLKSAAVLPPSSLSLF